VNQAPSLPFQTSLSDREFAHASKASGHAGIVNLGEHATTLRRVVAFALLAPKRRQHIGKAEALASGVLARRVQRTRSRVWLSSWRSRASSQECEQARGPGSTPSFGAKLRARQASVQFKGPRASGQAQQVVRDGRTSASAFGSWFLCAAQLRRYASGRRI
jgi:hypothetical protein